MDCFLCQCLLPDPGSSNPLGLGHEASTIGLGEGFLPKEGLVALATGLWPSAASQGDVNLRFVKLRLGVALSEA